MIFYPNLHHRYVAPARFPRRASGRYSRRRNFFLRLFLFVGKIDKRKLIAGLLLVSGMILMFDAGYIHAKAWLGQRLLERAWQMTQQTHRVTKAWWWADSFPVARLGAPRHQKTILVLHGVNGEALAWGPGWLPSSVSPGAEGNSVIAAHRDTHFHFLRNIRLGDEIIVEDAQRRKTVYQVTQTRISDAATMQAAQANGEKILTLVTCYPFDALATTSTQRFIVEARAVVDRV
ncbi:MAG: class GN sortase [Burkholderiales bacterium]|jgi:sortase A|nr:class GN sortase [Burkholderiales bacterium]